MGQFHPILTTIRSKEKGTMNDTEIKNLMELSGKEYAEKFRQIDEALAQVLDNPYGRLLMYYPPVYVISKCFEFWRPYYLEFIEENELSSSIQLEDNNKNGSIHFDNNGGIHMEQSPKTTKKTINWMFGKNEKDRGNFELNDNAKIKATSQESPKQGKKPNLFSRMSIKRKDKDTEKERNNLDNGKEESIRTAKGKEQVQFIANPKDMSNSADDLFYPCEGSDIDEDDDSDMEGEYTFHHDDEDDDRMSVGTISIQSEKDMIEKYEKELKIKLVENLVNKDTKEENKKPFNKHASIKRMFNRSK